MDVVLMKRKGGNKPVVIGHYEIFKEYLDQESHRFSITSGKESQACKIDLQLKKARVEARSLRITDIRMKLKAGNDIIGISEPYLVGQIGTWRGRTETLAGEDLRFDR